MENLIDDILDGINHGHPLIPTDNKVPTVKTWKTKDNEYNVSLGEVSRKSFVREIAYMMGNDIEAIDIDTKYDITGTLYQDYCEDIHALDESIMSLLTIQRTESGGYHFVYRCKGLTDGNRKLARRHATEEEQEKGERTKVLIETRGVGGYICVEPTKGYEIIQGNITDIQEITPEQRDVLFDVAKSFNSYNPKEQEAPIKSKKGELTPFDDYDERTSDDEVLGLLVKHGWTIVSQNREKVAVRRAGDTKAKHSGYYFLDSRRLFVHSTSTVFEPETLYKPYAIYTHLEFNGNYNDAAAFLFKNGYGVLPDKIERVKTHEIKPFGEEHIFSLAKVSEDVALSYISGGVSAKRRLQDFYEGRVHPAYITGNENFDSWFAMKINTFYVLTSKTGVGKTTTMQFLQAMFSVTNGLRGGIAALENDEADYRENMITFLTGMRSKELYHVSREAWEYASKYVDDHFVFFEKCSDLETLLSVVASTMHITKIDYLFVDPINSIPPAKGKSWEYSTAIHAASVVLEFRRSVCSIFISQHPTIGKQRETGVLRSVDGEFGALINKADVGITLTRNKTDERYSKTTELHIDKDRTVKYGGRETFQESPIKLNYLGTGFEIEAPLSTEHGAGMYTTYYSPFTPIISLKDKKHEQPKREPIALSDKEIEDVYMDEKKAY